MLVVHSLHFEYLKTAMNISKVQFSRFYDSMQFLYFSLLACILFFIVYSDVM